jgi:hypothetical protein
MVSSSPRPKQGTGPFFKIFQVLQRYYNAEYVFLTVNGSPSWLNNVSVYLVQVSFRLLGQRGLGHFFRYRPLLPIGWSPGGLCKLYANAGGKRQIQRQQRLVQYKQQANPLLLMKNLYSTCDKWE